MISHKIVDPHKNYSFIPYWEIDENQCQTYLSNISIELAQSDTDANFPSPQIEDILRTTYPILTKSDSLISDQFQ